VLVARWTLLAARFEAVTAGKAKATVRRRTAEVESFRK
jgi:hypothetical protein